MNFIVNPNTFEKYSIFSKDGTLLLKKYVKLYQSGGTKETIKQLKERMLRETQGGEFRSPPEMQYPSIRFPVVPFNYKNLTIGIEHFCGLNKDGNPTRGLPITVEESGEDNTRAKVKVHWAFINEYGEEIKGAQLFYRSTGENSGNPGAWFPTNGHMATFSQTLQLASIIYKKPFLIRPDNAESTNRYFGKPILHFIGQILLPFATEDTRNSEFKQIQTYEKGENMIDLFTEFFNEHAKNIYGELYPNYTGSPTPNTRAALPENSPICDMLTINMWSGSDVMWENPEKGNSMDPRNSPGYFEVIGTNYLVPIENALNCKRYTNPFGAKLITKEVFTKTHKELVEIGKNLMKIGKKIQSAAAKKSTKQSKQPAAASAKQSTKQPAAAKKSTKQSKQPAAASANTRRRSTRNTKKTKKFSPSNYP